MQKGFVKIPRHFFETSFWNEKRKFSKTDALLDILQNTDYKHGVLRTSYRALADRWQWNLPAVQRYVKSIVKEGFVFVHSDTGGITFKSKCDTPSDTPSDTPKQPKTKAVSEIDDTPSDTPSDTPRAYKNNIFNHSIEEEKEKRNNFSNEKFKENFGKFDFSFISDDMAETYFRWLSFRKQLKKPFNTQMSIEQNYRKLLKYAGNSPVQARLIVDQSIEYQWQGLFPLKEKKQDPMQIGVKLEDDNPEKYKKSW